MEQPPIVILAAMRAEATLLEQDIGDAAEHVVAGKRFVTGQLGETLIALAWTGMGKGNAAMVTTLALHEFHPAAGVGTGIAGATNPEFVPGDVLIADRGNTRLDQDLIALFHAYAAVKQAA